MTQASQGALPARLAVIGAGAWGTVLAWLLANNGHRVSLWTRRKALARDISEQGTNSAYAPGLCLPETLRASSDLCAVVEDAEAAVIAVPSQALREVLTKLPSVPAVISCSKGLEPGTLNRFTQIVAEYQPEANLAALSGPNLAAEIAAGQPAAATLAADAAFAGRAQAWLSSETFRVYTSTDLVGVEVAGAMKNVIALAAGMCDGLSLGDNAKATILTRGLAEMVRLGKHLGGEMTTFYGLAGLGDMVATCQSERSRNHRAGRRLVQGEPLASLEQSLTAEGIPTVKAVYAYAREKGLELPITTEVYRVIYEAKAPYEAIQTLMLREVGSEW